MIRRPPRSTLFPYTPLSRSGPADLIVNSFVSLLAPKGVDAALRDRIHADVVAVLQDPQVREKFATFAFQPITWEVPEMEKLDRKSTRLNSSHLVISYAVFCLKKKRTYHLLSLTRSPRVAD